MKQFCQVVKVMESKTSMLGLSAALHPYLKFPSSWKSKTADQFYELNKWPPQQVSWIMQQLQTTVSER